ncbi:5-guanidino-2-oxopentanoate decarboxylase [Dongia deserti]|uniref:5-guanidino-2-oxopentanoate decarboxylase n=1 Tax=Dongia deserti TaxID=2268030 RepID=UPI000E649A75|nr:5-guanidino-2-oxopentanoate decarboxylase [Dongia deserti]
MRTVGMYLAELLEAYGVEVIFGIPGVHTVELYRGLPNTKIRHVTPRHEQGAGFMADGYARVSGRPGVCFIITGPGMTNIATAMAQAYADSVPMLVISAVNALGQIGSGEGWLHELQDQRQLIKQVSAFSHTVMTPAELPRVMARAFALFAGSRPRPVHIELPLDIITAPADKLPPIRAIVPPSPPAASPSALQEAANWLNIAKAPVLLLGGGAQDAGSFVRAIAEKLDAPTVMSVNGRGLLPPRHPLAVPCSPSMPPTMKLIEGADVILAIGTEFGSTDYDWFEQGGAKFNGKTIRIDIDAQQVVRSRQPDLPIVADASEASSALVPLLSSAKRDGAARAAAARDAVLADLSRTYRACLHLMETVRDALPGAVLVGDSAQPVYAGCICYPSAAPRSWFCSATGYGTLGYALPAAIGAQLAAADRPVVCLIGDGGLQFTIAELASAREAGTPVIVLLWNNNGYGEIKTYMVSRQIHPIGVDIFTPDFQVLAKGFGCEAVTLKKPSDLPGLLREAAKRKTATIIEIEENDYVANYEG